MPIKNGRRISMLVSPHERSEDGKHFFGTLRPVMDVDTLACCQKQRDEVTDPQKRPTRHWPYWKRQLPQSMPVPNASGYEMSISFISKLVNSRESSLSASEHSTV